MTPNVACLFMVSQLGRTVDPGTCRAMLLWCNGEERARRIQNPGGNGEPNGDKAVADLAARASRWVMENVPAGATITERVFGNMLKGVEKDSASEPGALGPSWLCVGSRQ